MTEFSTQKPLEKLNYSDGITSKKSPLKYKGQRKGMKSYSKFIEDLLEKLS